VQYLFSLVGSIADQALNETLGSSTSTLPALQPAALNRQVDRINRKFVNAARDNAIERWSWLGDTQTEFETYDATSLSAAAAKSAATFAVASVTGFPTSGRVWLDTVNNAVDFVDYASIATLTATVSTATGAETITVAHDSGDHCELLYALPSDFGSVIQVLVDGNEYTEDKVNPVPTGGKYRLFDSYILFPMDIGTTDVVLRYEKGATTLFTGNDAADRLLSTNIPVDFERFAIESLIAYIHIKRRKKDAAIDALTLAKQELDAALAADNPSTYIY